MKSIDIVKVKLVKEATLRYEYPAQIDEASTAAHIARTFIGDSDRECFVVMMLDIKHRINKIELVALGGLDGCFIGVREVFKSAILANSAAIIVAHNHPSGDVTPSREDIKLTESLVKAGELLDIPVLDHIIIGEGSYSFKNDGRI